LRGLFAVYRRELSALFATPLAWTLLAATLFLNGFLMVLVLEEAGGDVAATIEVTLGGSWIFWVLLATIPPILTMGMLAGEYRSGMMEYLLTAPVTDGAVVTGKFLAATSFMAVLWSSYLIYGLTFTLLGTPPDWYPLIGAFIGAVLASALFCAVGILSSAAVSHPAPAVLLGFLANVMLIVAPRFLDFSSSRGSMLDAVLELGDVMGHFHKSFNIGLLDTGPIVFFVASTSLLLFLSARLVESRRWW
jgi:ABC-2 type transport system permease protein